MIVLIYGSLHPGVMTRCPMFWSRAFFFVKHHLHDVIVAHRIRAASCVFIWQRGHKAFIDLEYAKFDPNLHTQLFAKHLGQVKDVYDGLKNGNMKTVGKHGFAENAGGIHWFQVYPVE